MLRQSKDYIGSIIAPPLEAQEVDPTFQPTSTGIELPPSENTSMSGTLKMSGAELASLYYSLEPQTYTDVPSKTVNPFDTIDQNVRKSTPQPRQIDIGVTSINGDLMSIQGTMSIQGGDMHMGAFQPDPQLRSRQGRPHSGSNPEVMDEHLTPSAYPSNEYAQTAPDVVGRNSNIQRIPSELELVRQDMSLDNNRILSYNVAGPITPEARNEATTAIAPFPNVHSGQIHQQQNLRIGTAAEETQTSGSAVDGSNEQLSPRRSSMGWQAIPTSNTLSSLGPSRESKPDELIFHDLTPSEIGDLIDSVSVGLAKHLDTSHMSLSSMLPRVKIQQAGGADDTIVRGFAVGSAPSGTISESSSYRASTAVMLPRGGPSQTNDSSESTSTVLHNNLVQSYRHRLSKVNGVDSSVEAPRPKPKHQRRPKLPQLDGPSDKVSSDTEPTHSAISDVPSATHTPSRVQSIPFNVESRDSLPEWFTSSSDTCAQQEEPDSSPYVVFPSQIVRGRRCRNTQRQKAPPPRTNSSSSSSTGPISPDEGPNGVPVMPRGFLSAPSVPSAHTPNGLHRESNGLLSMYRETTGYYGPSNRLQREVNGPLNGSHQDMPGLPNGPHRDTNSFPTNVPQINSSATSSPDNREANRGTADMLSLFRHRAQLPTEGLLQKDASHSATVSGYITQMDLKAQLGYFPPEVYSSHGTQNPVGPAGVRSTMRERLRLLRLRALYRPVSQSEIPDIEGSNDLQIFSARIENIDEPDEEVEDFLPTAGKKWEPFWKAIDAAHIEHVEFLQRYSAKSVSELDAEVLVGIKPVDSFNDDSSGTAQKQVREHPNNPGAEGPDEATRRWTIFQGFGSKHYLDKAPFALWDDETQEFREPTKIEHAWIVNEYLASQVHAVWPFIFVQTEVFPNPLPLTIGRTYAVFLHTVDLDVEDEYNSIPGLISDPKVKYSSTDLAPLADTALARWAWPSLEQLETVVHDLRQHCSVKAITFFLGGKIFVELDTDNGRTYASSSLPFRIAGICIFYHYCPMIHWRFIDPQNPEKRSDKEEIERAGRLSGFKGDDGPRILGPGFPIESYVTNTPIKDVEEQWTSTAGVKISHAGTGKERITMHLPRHQTGARVWYQSWKVGSLIEAYDEKDVGLVRLELDEGGDFRNSSSINTPAPSRLLTWTDIVAGRPFAVGGLNHGIQNAFARGFNIDLDPTLPKEVRARITPEVMKNARWIFQVLGRLGKRMSDDACGAAIVEDDVDYAGVAGFYSMGLKGWIVASAFDELVEEGWGLACARYRNGDAVSSAFTGPTALVGSGFDGCDDGYAADGGTGSSEGGGESDEDSSGDGGESSNPSGSSNAGAGASNALAPPLEAGLSKKSRGKRPSEDYAGHKGG
ncbi:MAG: hypothetical protein MMC33_004369 [Icmadophila ericetorum]|nr:hypothetical protein [Icmadophila ericetorum]